MAYCTYNLIGALLASSALHILAATNHKLSLRLINRHSIFTDHSSQDDDIRAPAMPQRGGTLFLANISVGDPPVPQLLHMDTGSHITWVRCHTTTTCDSGCDNTFDPDKSSTYKDVPFNTPPCTNFDYLVEEDGGVSPCSYEATYADSSSSRGFLAFERYTFVTSTDGVVQVSDAVLGCAFETSPPDFGGILGLVPTSEHHLVARTGNKFSYCIGNISDPQYMYNHLILGEGSIIQGDSTPMQIRDNHYVVSLEGISVGETQLTIDPLEFDSNVVIDSGSMYTRLVRSAYEPLVAEIMFLADGFLVRAEVRNIEVNQLCYEGDLERDLKGFPVVTLHLAGGADLDLDVEGLFRRASNGKAFCLAIIESDVNVIGIVSQQYYNVGFDIDAKRISFERIDCQLLED